MKIKQYEIDGTKLIEVENEKGLKITFINKGASIYTIYLNNEIMTLSPKNIKDFIRDDLYYGKSIGPICSRILNGKVTINGIDYYLDVNAGTNNEMALHGGKHGYSTLFFDYKIKENEDEVKIIFTKLVKNMEYNYPGNVKLTFIYSIKKEENTLILDTKFISDKDAIFSLTNHAYFSLNEKHIKDLELYINASNHVLLDKNTSLPVKEEKVNEIIDFRKFKNLYQDYNSSYLQDTVAKGYDHNYILDNPCLDKPSIILRSKKHKLEIYTTFNGVQTYTCNYSDDIDFINVERGKNHGIALEPQIPLSRRKIVPMNEEQSFTTIYKFF